MKFKPRNDNVLIRVEVNETLNGIHMPQSSPEGQKFTVEAIGYAVEHLSVGDEVLLKGAQNVDWAMVPGTKNLLMIGEKNVVAVVKE